MKLLCRITVLGFTPVPWSVPHFGSGVSATGKKYSFSRRTRKSRPEILSLDFDKWQKMVELEATTEMERTRTKVSSAPIKLDIIFMKRTPEGKRNCELWFPGVKQNDEGKWIKLGASEPDLTNLVKAVEDCLQGVVYHDDFQVRKHDVEMVYAEHSGVRILVHEIEGHDFPGQGDPVEILKSRKRKRAIPAKAGES